MGLVRDTLRWLVFLFLGVVLQVYVPGLDALSVGVLAAVDERDYKSAVWLAPAVIVLQEGMGTQYFGASLLHLAAFLAVLLAARSLPVTSRLLVSLLVAAGMGASRILLDILFAALQNAPHSLSQSVDDGVIEAVYVLVAWHVLARFGRSRRHDDQAAASA